MSSFLLSALIFDVDTIVCRILSLSFSLSLSQRRIPSPSCVCFLFQTLRSLRLNRVRLTRLSICNDKRQDASSLLVRQRSTSQGATFADTEEKEFFDMLLESRIEFKAGFSIQRSCKGR